MTTGPGKSHIDFWSAATRYLQERGWKLYNWKNIRLICEAPAGRELVDEGEYRNIREALQAEFANDRDAWNEQEKAYLQVTNLPDQEAHDATKNTIKAAKDTAK